MSGHLSGCAITAQLVYKLICVYSLSNCEALLTSAPVFTVRILKLLCSLPIQCCIANVSKSLCLTDIFNYYSGIAVEANDTLPQLTWFYVRSCCHILQSVIFSECNPQLLGK